MKSKHIQAAVFGATGAGIVIGIAVALIGAFPIIVEWVRKAMAGQIPALQMVEAGIMIAMGSLFAGMILFWIALMVEFVYNDFVKGAY